MRRMVKENLLKFDGTPLFPERVASTVPYRLSDAEAQLYREVTGYVRDEFNRVEALPNASASLSMNTCYAISAAKFTKQKRIPKSSATGNGRIV